MPALFIKYVLPVIVVISIQIYLSNRDNRYVGLLVPLTSFILTAVFMVNAFHNIGILVAFAIMLVPNTLTLYIHLLVRKVKRIRDKEVIKLKFKDKA